MVGILIYSMCNVSISFMQDEHHAVKDIAPVIFCGWNCFLFLLLQHSEEMYDAEIYRHQITEYYNPYVLDADIQAGEFYFNNPTLSHVNTVWIESPLVLLKVCHLYILD